MIAVILGLRQPKRLAAYSGTGLPPVSDVYRTRHLPMRYPRRCQHPGLRTTYRPVSVVSFPAAQPIDVGDRFKTWSVAAPVAKLSVPLFKPVIVKVALADRPPKQCIARPAHSLCYPPTDSVVTGAAGLSDFLEVRAASLNAVFPPLAVHL